MQSSIDILNFCYSFLFIKNIIICRIWTQLFKRIIHFLASRLLFLQFLYVFVTVGYRRKVTTLYPSFLLQHFIIWHKIWLKWFSMVYNKLSVKKELILETRGYCNYGYFVSNLLYQKVLKVLQANWRSFIIYLFGNYIPFFKSFLLLFWSFQKVWHITPKLNYPNFPTISMCLYSGKEQTYLHMRPTNEFLEFQSLVSGMTNNVDAEISTVASLSTDIFNLFCF